MPSHLFETISWLSFPHAGDNLHFNHGPLLWIVVFCSVCLFLLRTTSASTAPWKCSIRGASYCSEAKLVIQTPAHVSRETSLLCSLPSGLVIFESLAQFTFFFVIKTQAVWSQFWPFKLLQVNLWLKAWREGMVIFCERSMLCAQRVTIVC